MIKKHFNNKIFGIVLLIIVSFDLINSIMKLTETYSVISILVLRCINLLLCLTALVFFFLANKYSISILKLYIVFKLIMFPSYIILRDLKDLVIYSASRMSVEDYISYLFSLIFGITVFYFFRKYKIEN